MKKVKFTFILMISLLIASCGFHLRGNLDLSSVLPEVQIQGVSKHSELGRELTRALISANVNVLDESEVLISITKDSFSRRVLSLDSLGRANQYELSYQLAFSLVKKLNTKDNNSDKKDRLVDLIATQNISEKREYLFDADLNLLAFEDEETRLNNDMRQAALLQLVRRLKFSLKSKNKVPK